MTFQRRHYQKIADIIKDLPDGKPVALAFAKEFDRSQPGFDHDRFLRACGVPA